MDYIFEITKRAQKRKKHIIKCSEDENFEDLDEKIRSAFKYTTWDHVSDFRSDLGRKGYIMGTVTPDGGDLKARSPLSECKFKVGDEFYYVYDLGANIQHTIVVKDIKIDERIQNIEKELLQEYIQIVEKGRIPENVGSYFLIEIFLWYLGKGKKGLKENTLKKHQENLNFFFKAFLCNYHYYDEELDALHYKYNNMNLDDAENIYEKVMILDAEYRSNIDLREMSSTTIETFLTDFCLRKLWTFKKSDIGSFLSTFKKFYKFLLDYKAIDEKIYDEILDAWGDSKYYRDAYDDYFDEDDGDDDYDENYEKFDGLKEIDELLEQDGLIETVEGDKLNVDYKEKEISMQFVQKTISDLKEQKILIPLKTQEFIDDIECFLTYCLKDKKVKVGKNYLTFKRKDIEAITKKFHQDVFLKPNFFQWDVPYFHALYSLLLELELIEINDKYYVEEGYFLENYKNLNNETKILLIFLNLWDLIEWKKLFKPSAGGRPEWAQKKRFIMADAFAEAEAGIDYNFREYLNEYKASHYSKNNEALEIQNKSNNNKQNSSFNGIKMLVALLNNPHSDFWIDLDVFDFGVVPNVILPVLDTMGLFELTFLPPKSDYAKKNPSLHRHIEKFKINDFAKIIWLNYVEFFRLNYPPLKG